MSDSRDGDEDEDDWFERALRELEEQEEAEASDRTGESEGDSETHAEEPGPKETEFRPENDENDEAIESGGGDLAEAFGGESPGESSENGGEPDPFSGDSGESDPFGGDSDESDPFGGDNDESDPFGGDSGSDESDPFGGSGSDESDQFGGDSDESDPFGGDSGSGSDESDPFGGDSGGGSGEPDSFGGGDEFGFGGDDDFGFGDLGGGGSETEDFGFGDLGGGGGGGGGGDEFGFGGGGGEADFDEEEFESDIDRIKVGIEGLDQMILGGVPKRSLMVAIGSAGTGKTTFGMQFLNESLRNGGTGVYITLEESRDAIFAAANEKGWDFREHADENRLAIVSLDPIEMANSLSSIRNDISRLVDDFGADRLVLDSVSLLEMMYDHPAKRRSEVFDFARSLKRAGVTTMLTSEADESNPYTSRYGIVEYLVDAVFVLQYVRPSDFRETRLAVEIQKIRNANHSRETKPYELTADGISVYRQANIF